MLYLNLSCPVRLCVGEHLLNSLYAGLIRNGRAACMALGLSSLAMAVQKVAHVSVATDNFLEIFRRFLAPLCVLSFGIL